MLPLPERALELLLGLRFCMGTLLTFIIGTFLFQRQSLKLRGVSLLRRTNLLLHAAASLWILVLATSSCALRLQDGFDSLLCFNPDPRDVDAARLEAQLHTAFLYYYLSKVWELLDVWLQLLDPSPLCALGLERQIHHNFTLPLIWILWQTQSPSLLAVLMTDSFFVFFQGLYLAGLYEAFPAVSVFGTVDRLAKLQIFGFLLYRRVVAQDPCDGEVTAECLCFVVGLAGLAAWWWALGEDEVWPHRHPSARTCLEQLGNNTSDAIVGEQSAGERESTGASSRLDYPLEGQAALRHRKATRKPNKANKR